jgi:predicted nucleic acid-binding protein
VLIVDASALVEYLLGSAAGHRVADRLSHVETIDAPHVIDLEVSSALRRHVAAGRLEERRAAEALTTLALAPLRRYPATLFLSRIWELRHTHTAYDAAYVALAEALDAPLLTLDSRLARSHGHRAEIELVAP